jgi:hypothetical protein
VIDTGPATLLKILLLSWLEAAVMMHWKPAVDLKPLR